MKRLTPIAAGLTLVAGMGAGALSLPLDGWAQDDEDVVVKLRVPRAKPGTVEEKTEVAEAKPKAEVAEAKAEPKTEPATEETEPEADGDDVSSSKTTEKEEESMSDDKSTEKTPEDQEAFRQTMHEGDIALGVCGARVSALLWFYEASVAQGRDDLKSAVESRVMNSESEKIWDDLNKKAGGDGEEFQKAHDELFAGVQECLALFFERPEAESGDAAKE